MNADQKKMGMTNSLSYLRSSAFICGSLTASGGQLYARPHPNPLPLSTAGEGIILRRGAASLHLTRYRPAIALSAIKSGDFAFSAQTCQAPVATWRASLRDATASV